MFNSLRLRPSAPVRAHQKASTQLEVEPLEDRQLLSGGLDPAFAGAGKRTIPLPSGVSTEWATAVAVQKDGDIVLAGQAGSGPGSTFDIVRLRADGTNDTSFGTNGHVTVQFNGATTEVVSSVAIDPDTQKILVAGTITTTDGQSTDTAFAVARLNADGSLDTGFNGSGEETVEVGGQATARGATTASVTLSTVALQDNGKVLLSGTVFTRQFQVANTESLVVVRLNKDGGVDTSFGSGGQASVPVAVAASNSAGAAAPLAVGEDGKIVVAGTTGAPQGTAAANYFTVARLTSAGQLDTTFGTGGQTSFGFGTNLDNEVTSVAVLGNGRVVVGGFTRPDGSTGSNSDFALAKLNADGSLDTDFNGTGVQTLGFDLGGTNADQINALAVQDDGKILAVGSAVTATLSNVNGDPVTSAHFALARFNKDGSLDSSFGAGGKVDFGYALGALADDQATAVALAPDGRLIVAGSVSLNSISPEVDAMAVARVLATGRPPESIGSFDPHTATWYLRNTTSPGSPSITPFAYGGKNWAPVVGDWTGDGQKTIGVFDPSTATWYLKNDNNSGAPSFTPFRYGAPGWIPVVGDWNGDGTDTIGVVDPTTETWYLRNSNSPGAPDITPFRYGAPGWVPVVGDWGGSGTTGVGVVDPKTMTWYLKNSDSAGAPDFKPFVFGTPGSKPVVGDWNSDGTTTVGYVAKGTWYLRNHNSAGPADLGRFAFGSKDWVPVAGNWSMPEAPLLAAGGEHPGAAVTGTATATDLAAMVSTALTRLGNAGADPTFLARLATAQVVFAKLAPGHLAEVNAKANTITLDTNAAGYGWFVDPSPLQDGAFQANTAVAGLAAKTGILTAGAGSAALGRMDLLSAVLFSLAQLAGLDLSTPGLLQPKLATGVRKVNQVLNVFDSLNATLPQASSSSTSTQPPLTTGQPTTTANPNLPVLGLPVSGPTSTPPLAGTATPTTTASDQTTNTTNKAQSGTSALTSPFVSSPTTTSDQSTTVQGQPTMDLSQMTTSGPSSSPASSGLPGF
jgi:uncharacterized delta-60 repeat protein